MFAINLDNLKKIKYYFFLKKTLSLFIVYSRWGHEYEKIFKEEESIKILKILGLTTDIKEYQKIVSEENLSQEFSLKNIGETRNYLIEEINQNQLISFQ